MATDLGTYPDLEERYKIPISDEGSIYRLFVNGSPHPYINEDGFDLETWISRKTGIIPKPNLIYHLSDDTHEQFVKLTKKVNAFIMLYIPQNPRCQQLSIKFAHLAEVFQVLIHSSSHP